MTIPLSTKPATKSVATRTTRAVPPTASGSRPSRAPEPPAQPRAAEVRNGKRKRAPAELAFIQPPAKKPAPARPTRPTIPVPTPRQRTTAANGAGPSRPTAAAAARPATTRVKRSAPLKPVPPEITQLFDEIKVLTADIAHLLDRSHEFSPPGKRPVVDQDTEDMVGDYVGADMLIKLWEEDHRDDPKWAVAALKAVISAQVYCAMTDCDIAVDRDSEEHLAAREAVATTLSNPEGKRKLGKRTRHFYTHELPPMPSSVLEVRTLDLAEAVLKTAGGSARNQLYKRSTGTKIKRVIACAMKLRNLCGDVGSADHMVFYPYPETPFAFSMMKAQGMDDEDARKLKKIFCATSISLMRRYTEEVKGERKVKRSVRPEFRADIIASPPKRPSKLS